jgi:prepilin-type N-terminal cleavage/methylation domain-containing protein
VTRRLTALRDERGFTLSEMLVVLAILGLVFGMFSLVVSSSIRHSTEVQESSILQTEARAAVERFATDLRQAYTGDEDTSTFPIIGIANTWVEFYSPDRQIPFHLRRVRYELVSGKLQRSFATSTDTDGWPWLGLTILGTPQKLVGSVRNSTPFTYFDENGNSLAATAGNRLLVRTVKLTLAVSPVSAQSRSSTYETSVTLRADL